MSASNRGFRGKSSTYPDRVSADLPENVGNRRTFEELKIPPDNVGNQEERDTIATFVHDSLGNSLDEEPSHLRSGILSQLVGIKEKQQKRRVSRDVSMHAAKSLRMQKPRIHANNAARERVADGVHEIEGLALSKALIKLSAEDYMAHLTNEFNRLLRLRLGVPFSFSMKPITGSLIDEEGLLGWLRSIEKLIREILGAAAITASVSFTEYRTANHRFAVFYVSPKEKDPVKNKDLISALRQIVKLHATKHPAGQVNVLLVLANAQHVIEDHLFKLGAKKVEI